MPNTTDCFAAAHLVDTTDAQRLDVLGPMIELLTGLAANADAPCIMRGTIAPGGIVPLHSHADPEIFVQQQGALEGLSHSADGFRWLTIRPGDVFSVPGGAKHGFRNPGREPAISLIVSTVRMGRFFERIGAPIIGGKMPVPVTPDRLEHFLKVADEFGYWNGSPAENAAVGLSLPVPTV